VTGTTTATAKPPASPTALEELQEQINKLARNGDLSRRNVLCFTLAAGVLASAGVSTLARASDAAMALIEPFGAALATLAQNGRAPFAQRFTQFAPAVDETFDLQEILRISVGSNWDTMNSDQQNQLLQVFRRYTVASFVANFDKPEGQFRVTGTRDLGTQTVVDSTIGKTTLGFVVRQTTAGWRVVDVLADGSVSRVATQRSDFRDALMHGGGPALIAKLQRKVSDLSGGGLA